MATFRVTRQNPGHQVEPGQYYALIQSTKQDSVTLELIDANYRLLDNSQPSVSWRSGLRKYWIDAFTSPSRATQLDAANELELSMREFKSAFISVDLGPLVDDGHRFNYTPEPSVWNQWHADGAWLALTISARSETTGSISDISPVDAPRQNLLERVFGMALWPSTAAADIERALQATRPIVGCLIVDVGQASANALVARNGLPSIYFDVGSPLSRDTSTSKTYCTHGQPLVILSHWHKDHWGGEKHNPELLQQTWIAPRQKLGLHQTQFATRILAAGGTLHIMKRSSVGRARRRNHLGQSYELLLEYCTGPRGSLNNSGLALNISWPEQDEHWLLPGDADYDHIPPRMTAPDAPTLLVASHHGATQLRRTTAPAPGNSHSNRRLVYSYGTPNSYGHPTGRSKSLHQAAGWLLPTTGFWGVDARTTAGTGASGRCSIACGVGSAIFPRRHLAGSFHGLNIRS